MIYSVAIKDMGIGIQWDIIGISWKYHGEFFWDRTNQPTLSVCIYGDISQRIFTYAILLYGA